MGEQNVFLQCNHIISNNLTKISFHIFHISFPSQFVHPFNCLLRQLNSHGRFLLLFILVCRWPPFFRYFVVQVLSFNPQTKPDLLHSYSFMFKIHIDPSL